MNNLVYCGLKNYLSALNNSEFWHSIEITLVFSVIVVAFHVTIGLMLALVVNRRFVGRTFIRAAFFIPVIMSTVVVGEIWRFMYSNPDGLFNKMLGLFGIAAQPWIQSEKHALVAMIIVTVWRYVGYHMVIYLAALQDIPVDLYENAELAGANAWYKFRCITLPLLSNTTWFLIIISIINTSQVFDQIYVMTQGGPFNSTNVIVYYIYNQAFRLYNLGYASAVAWLMFVIIFALTVLQLRFSRKDQLA